MDSWLPNTLPAVQDARDRREMKMLPERRTVGDLLAHLAQAMPQQEAVVLPPRRLTYAALYAQAMAVAGGLWQLGIRPGEPVALLVSNRPEWITVARGCAQHVVASGGDRVCLGPLPRCCTRNARRIPRGRLPGLTHRDPARSRAAPARTALRHPATGAARAHYSWATSTDCSARL